MDFKASVFIATSLDGFIARRDGSLDWLPAGGGEPHGYDEFIDTVDALVIGRKTFETASTFDPWPYGKKSVIVLTSRPEGFVAPADSVCEAMAASPREVVTRLAERGMKHLYVDGGVTSKLKISTPSDREIAMTRAFDAPRSMVFDAWTKPALLNRWLGVFGGWSFVVCEIDLKVGGKYRYVWRGKDGNEMGMGGVSKSYEKLAEVLAGMPAGSAK